MLRCAITQTDLYSKMYDEPFYFLICKKKRETHFLPASQTFPISAISLSLNSRQSQYLSFTSFVTHVAEIMDQLVRRSTSMSIAILSASIFQLIAPSISRADPSRLSFAVLRLQTPYQSRPIERVR